MDAETCFLDILDTAGQEEYAALRDGYMRNGQGFLLVFNIIERKSLEELNQFRDHILRVKDKDAVPIVMIGNKCDLESERQVSKQEGQNVAQGWSVPFFEASAKANINVHESFYELVREVRKDIAKSATNKVQPSKPSHKKKCSIL